MNIGQLWIGCLLLFCNTAWTQIDFSDAFRDKLDKGQLLYLAPVEGRYKDAPTWSNEWWSSDLTIKSNQEKIEIRYAIHPTNGQPSFNVPQVKMMQVLSNVATNDQTPVIAVHSIPQEEIEKDYAADWAAIAYFSPKLSFSQKQHCKVLCLHRDGAATVFVFFLFDKPTDELEEMMYTIRFKERDDASF